VTDESPARPFCSPRCRLIDLGNWLSGRYRIAGEKNVDEAAVPSAPDSPASRNSTDDE
jgi:endogenous inhibitor of DNA gyrase (YacG/DUF329 family)